MIGTLPKGLRHNAEAEAGSELEEIRATAGGHGVDAAFVMAGEQEAVDVTAVSVLPGGQASPVGIPVDDRTIPSASPAHCKGFTIKLGRRMKHRYPLG
jgi:threonine dehydrogenase-like Zn-dependent dehydrogenase